jgi:hypothetical protein
MQRSADIKSNNQLIVFLPHLHIAYFLRQIGQRKKGEKDKQQRFHSGKDNLEAGKQKSDYQPAVFKEGFAGSEDFLIPKIHRVNRRGRKFSTPTTKRKKIPRLRRGRMNEK